jgi:hypothetical protein
MRSHMKCLAAALLLCFTLVSGSGAWALPVHGSAPVPMQERPLADTLRDWVGSLLVRAGILPKGDVPDPTPSKPKEGPQIDPNGGPH